MLSFEEYLRIILPPMEEDFYYKQHGFDSWVIRTTGHSIEQLEKLKQKEYLSYVTTEFLSLDEGLEKALQEKPLVVFNRRHLGHFTKSFFLGELGVLLFKYSSTKSVIFGNPTDYFGGLTLASNSDFDSLDERFTTEERFFELNRLHCSQYAKTFIDQKTGEVSYRGVLYEVIDYEILNDGLLVIWSLIGSKKKSNLSPIKKFIPIEDFCNLDFSQ